MEPNAKDIIRAMECCNTDDGSCLNCPCIDDYNSCVGLSKNALALIKQLTEEVADLKAIAEGYQKQFEDCYEEKAKLTEENERLRAENNTYANGVEKIAINYYNKGKADTVREMQETFKEEVRKYADVICTEDAEWLIDQIAKEMLEGEK